MLTKSELEQMKNVDIRTVDKDSLVDLDSVVIDTSQPIEKRIKSFIAQVKKSLWYMLIMSQTSQHAYPIPCLRM